jgi:Gamma tubulin complex component C-terminal
VPQLLRPLAQKALTAGKYLNVVRDCVGDSEKGRLGVTSGSGPSGGKKKVILATTDADSLTASASTSTNEVDRDDALVITLPKERPLRFDLEGGGGSSLALAIEEAYIFSSRALLRLLEEQYNLTAHLKSLSSFFLLEHGDFFIQFMDVAEEELRKDVKDVSVSRVQGLLQLAIQTSTLASDPNRDDLTCSLASHNLIQHLHLIQVFRIDPTK